jgi:hypothetical protein
MAEATFMELMSFEVNPCATRPCGSDGVALHLFDERVCRMSLADGTEPSSPLRRERSDVAAESLRHRRWASPIPHGLSVKIRGVGRRKEETKGSWDPS